MFYSNYLPELSKENLYRRHLKYNEDALKQSALNIIKERIKKLRSGIFHPILEMHVLIFLFAINYQNITKKNLLLLVTVKNKHDF